MLNDLFILRNGLPIYVRSIKIDENSCKISTTLNNEQITIISGFFSAINSFAARMGIWGDIEELKMNSDTKFSFYKHYNDNILFVSSSNKHTDPHTTEMILKKIAEEFFHRFPDIEERKWEGNIDIFNDFDFIVKNVIKETEYILKSLNTNDIKKKDEELIVKPYNNDYKKFGPEKVLMNHLSNKILTEKIQMNNLKIKKNQELAFHKAQTNDFLPYSNALFYNLIPIKYNPEDGDIYDFFSGEDSKIVFKNIDGSQNIEKIGNSTGLPKDRVLNLCKGFIKMGLISFTK